MVELATCWQQHANQTIKAGDVSVQADTKERDEVVRTYLAFMKSLCKAAIYNNVDDGELLPLW